MNKNLISAIENIRDLEESVRYLSLHFQTWFSYRDVRERGEDGYGGKLWNTSTMSPITYNSIHLGCIGFLEYCKYLIHKYPQVTGSPPLYKV